MIINVCLPSSTYHGEEYYYDAVNLTEKEVFTHTTKQIPARLDLILMSNYKKVKEEVRETVLLQNSSIEI